MSRYVTCLAFLVSNSWKTYSLGFFKKNRSLLSLTPLLPMKNYDLFSSSYFTSNTNIHDWCINVFIVFIINLDVNCKDKDELIINIKTQHCKGDTYKCNSNTIDSWLWFWNYFAKLFKIIRVRRVVVWILRFKKE